MPGPTGRVYWSVRGVEPRRELVIEWRDFSHYDLVSGTVTFQLVLFEDHSNVLFNYSDVVFGNPELDGGASATVGVQSNAGIERPFSVDSPKLTDGMSLEWRMPEVQPRKSWLRQTFGGFDGLSIVLLGLVAVIIRRRSGAVAKLSDLSRRR